MKKTSDCNSVIYDSLGYYLNEYMLLSKNPKQIIDSTDVRFLKGEESPPLLNYWIPQGSINKIINTSIDQSIECRISAFKYLFEALFEQGMTFDIDYEERSRNNFRYSIVSIEPLILDSLPGYKIQKKYFLNSQLLDICFGAYNKYTYHVLSQINGNHKEFIESLVDRRSVKHPDVWKIMIGEPRLTSSLYIRKCSEARRKIDRK